MAHWARLHAGKVTEVVVADGPPAGLVAFPEPTPGGPGIGWTTADGGATWQEPVEQAAESNLTALQAAAVARLGQLEQWAANNPNGATLTAAQTLVLVRTVAGLVRVALGLVDTTGQAG